MKILKNGILKEKRVIKCTLCKCKFIARPDELYKAQTVMNCDALYVDCPECKKSIFIRRG